MNYYINNGTWYSEDELYHHGIKGQKWGVRRYQNEDGSLTAAGQKRYAGEYKKAMQKVQSKQRNMRYKMQLAAYNKTADEYNKHKIAEYNEKHSVDDPDYYDGYNKQFANDYNLEYTKKYLEVTKNDKNYKKAVELADKYKLWKYDDLAKANKDSMDAMEKYVEGKMSFDDLNDVIENSRMKIR